MLVLSRKRDESIMIGNDIVVTIVDIRGDKVRLGITAPTNVSVHRQEVYNAIQWEGRRSSSALAQPSMPAVQPPPDEAAKVRDPNYTPTLGEALRNPAEFVEGMQET